MPILIRNLPRSLTEQELQNLFAPFGEVLACDLVIDQKSGESKGFGFVELAEDDAVQKAINTLNSTVQQGQKIRVKWSNQEKKQSPHVNDNSTSSQSDGENVWASARPKNTDTPGDYD